MWARWTSRLGGGYAVLEWPSNLPSRRPTLTAAALRPRRSSDSISLPNSIPRIQNPSPTSSSISPGPTESTLPRPCPSALRGPAPLTHRRPSTHAFVPFEYCGCLSARSIIGRRHENPWLTGLVLPLPYRHPSKGVCFSYPWLEPTPIEVGVWEERLRWPAYTEVRASLSEVGIDSALDLLSTYAGRADDLRPWLEDAER